MRANRVMCVLQNSKYHHRYFLSWIDSSSSTIYHRKRIPDMNTKCGCVTWDKQHQQARVANDMIQKSLQSR